MQLVSLLTQGKLALGLIWRHNSIPLPWIASLHPTRTHSNPRWYNLTPRQKVRHTFAHTLKLTGRPDATKYALQTLVLKIYTHMQRVYFFFPRLNSFYAPPCKWCVQRCRCKPLQAACQSVRRAASLQDRSPVVCVNVRCPVVWAGVHLATKQSHLQPLSNI